MLSLRQPGYPHRPNGPFPGYRFALTTCALVLMTAAGTRALAPAEMSPPPAECKNVLSPYYGNVRAPASQIRDQIFGNLLGDPAEHIGNLLLRVLHEARRADLLMITSPLSNSFDLREVRRWSFAESPLPAGSTILFREPSAWQRYYRRVLLAPILFSLGTLLVVLLLFERRAAKREKELLASRYALGKQITEFSARLASNRTEPLDADIESGLGKLLGPFGAERICWYATRQGSPNLTRVYSAGDSAMSPSPASVCQEEMPFARERLLRGETVILRQLEDLPAEAGIDHQFFQRLSIKSLALIPSNTGASVEWVLGLFSGTPQKNWTTELLEPLSVLGDVIAAVVVRTEAEKARQESEKTFRSLFKEASIGIALENSEGRLLVVNPALCSMMGYTEQELCTMSCAQLTHPEDVEIDLALFKELQAGGRQNYQMDKRFLRKDRSEIWGRISVSLLKGAAEDSPLVIGLVENITEVRTGQDKLRASEVRLQSTLDALPNHVSILDENGTILAADATWRQLAARGGLLTAPLEVGGNFFDACDLAGTETNETARRAAQFVRFLLERKHLPEPALLFSRLDQGEPIWYQLRMSRFDENGVPRIVLSYENVSEIIRAREALVQSRETLELTLEASHTIAWEYNLETGRIWWAANQMGGERESRVETTYEQFLNLVHMEDRGRLNAAVGEAISSNQDFSVEFRVGGSGGAWAWILGKGRVHHENSGTRRMLGVNVDITDLKNAESELRRLTGRLIQAQEDERSRISRELHDDVAQQLALLLVGLDSLEDSRKDGRPVNEALVTLLKQRGNEIATSIHDLSHHLHSSKLRLLGLRSALTDLGQQFSEQHRIAIDLQIDRLPDSIPADVALCFYRVVQEALSNVARHSKAKEVVIQGYDAGGFLRFSIRDSGTGFDSARVDPRGIGLVSMRERLRMIGGELFVDSEVSRGTEIRAEVRLPLAARAATTGAGDA